MTPYLLFEDLVNGSHHSYGHLVSGFRRENRLELDLILSGADPGAEASDHRGSGALMYYSRSFYGPGGFAKEGDEKVTRILVRQDADDFLTLELYQDASGGVSARQDLNPGMFSNLKDSLVEGRVVGISCHNGKGVSLCTEPVGHPFPISIVSGDKNDAFAKGLGVHKVFFASHLHRIQDLIGRSLLTAEEVRGNPPKVLKDSARD
jgi:hypothetical protein